MTLISFLRNALRLRYGWEPSYLPSPCICSESFTVSHCLNCRLGDCPIYRHTCSYLRDHTAALMNILCSDVSAEPQLQPLSGKQLSLLSANRENHARSDVAVTDFWSKNRQQSCFNIRVFNPLASSNHASVNSVYQKHKKRQEYHQQVREIEHGCFSPLVFNTTMEEWVGCTSGLQKTCRSYCGQTTQAI